MGRAPEAALATLDMRDAAFKRRSLRSFTTQEVELAVRVDLTPGDDGLEVIKYWRDDAGRHFVPKRSLAKVLHRQRYGG